MTQVLVKLLKNHRNIDWKGAKSIPFVSYSISESDMRSKTATIHTNTHIDLSAGTYQILISDDDHENFAGIILSEDYDASKDEYSYKCQDFHRLYISKVNLSSKKFKGRQIVEKMLSFDNLPIKATKQQRKKYQKQLSGLKGNNKYQQENLGAVIRYNPLTQVYTNQTISDKTMMEVIEAYTIGTRSFIDLHFNDYGILQFTPYDIDNFINPTITISDVYNNWSWKSDTTNIITTASVENARDVTSGTFSKYELNDIFLEVNTFISNEKETTKTTTPATKTKKTKQKNQNPYCCKNKEVWVNMDEWQSSSHDYKFLNDFCKGLKKKGWKVHNLGRKPSTHTDYSKASKCKKGIWLTLDNGVDAEVFRHFANDTWFAQKLKNNKSVPVLGLMGGAGNIKKGGRYYKYLGMAHDGTGKGQPGLKYPAGYLASCGVPFFYAKNAKEAVEKFDKGGDSQKALETNFIKRKVRGGYYTNWNWGSEY